MALQSAGTGVTGNYIFNQAWIDVQLTGGTTQRLAVIKDISIKQDKTVKDLRALGSIMALALRTTDLKVSAKATCSSFNMALAQAFFLGPNQSGTADSTGFDYAVYDGQAIAIPILCVTGYAGPNLTFPFQVQFNNAVLKSVPIDFKVDDYGTMDLEWEAISTMVVDLLATQ